MTSSRSLLNTAGFTLVEITIVVAIAAAVTLALTKFQSDIFSLNRVFFNSFSGGDQAQKLLRPMTAEIRSASQSSNGAYPIESFGANDFAFFSDINNDGKKEWLRYYVSGTTMYKEVIVPTGSPLTYEQSNKQTSTFMTGVRNIESDVPTFHYYDATYSGGVSGEVASGTGDIEDIRLVRVTVVVDADPLKPPAAMEISTQVLIRNLKQQ